jgi:hypothetical protein
VLALQNTRTFINQWLQGSSLWWQCFDRLIVDLEGCNKQDAAKLPCLCLGMFVFFARKGTAVTMTQKLQL